MKILFLSNWTARSRYTIYLAVLALLSISSLNACQKPEQAVTDDPETSAATDFNDGTETTQAPAAVTSELAPSSHGEIMADSTDKQDEQDKNHSQDADAQQPASMHSTEVEVLSTEEILGETAVANTPPPSADADVAIIGTQISNVDYKGASGERLKVTYETSPQGELKAKATLPSGQRVNLAAPAGQGNNPTYRSADGNIEIVSHGGGGAVDLLQNGQRMSFDAVSAEAEVIPQ